MPVEAFISYCHTDERFRRELDAHLSLLQRQGLVATWHDRMISPGDNWAVRINHALDRCQLVLLLVSADFVRSDYCWGVEMKRALARHEAGTARVVPISVRRCDWTGAPFALFQALPKDAKPVDDWPKRDHAWTDVAKGIRKLVDPNASASAPPPDPPRAQQARPAGPPSPRPAAPAVGAWDTFLTSFARESAKKIARDGLPDFFSSLVGSEAQPPTTDEQPEHSLGELVAAVMTMADHVALGNLLRQNGLPVPRSKTDRAQAVAESFIWNDDLVKETFTFAQVKDLASDLGVPRGSKAAMAAGIVKAVRAMAGQEST